MPSKFELVKKGYNPDAVDAYIQDMEIQIKEYREKDAAISNAILNAQIAADDITQKANVAADTIIQNARNMSYQIMETTAKQVDGLLKSINSQKSKIQTFKDEYKSLIDKYIHQLDDSDFAEAEEKIQSLEIYLNRLMDVDIEQLASEDAEAEF